MQTKKKKGLQYVPGAADDGLGFFPAITCQRVDEGRPRVRWVVHHRRRQFQTKAEALASAEAEIALAFEDSSLPSSPERFLDHLRQRGFSELMDYRVAKTFDDDRRSVLGEEFQPPFGEAAARNDPMLHASILQAVNRQLAERYPPEAHEAFERLLAAGYSPEHIRRMMCLLMARGLAETMMGTKPFDTELYQERLRRLPEIPPL
jgi:hypothetical protein